MTTRSSSRWLLGLVLVSSACSTDPAREAIPAPPTRSGLYIVGAESARQITAIVTIDDRPGDDAAVGLQGRLHFDPAVLRYVGQEVAGTAILLVGETKLADGELGFAVLDRGPLAPRAAVFAFERIHPAGDPGLTLDLTRSTDGKGRSVNSLLGSYRGYRPRALPHRNRVG